MEKKLYGPKRLAEALDIDQRTAGAILKAIADVDLPGGTKRLSEEGYNSFLERCKNGNVPTKERPVGSKAKAPQWKPT